MQPAVEVDHLWQGYTAKSGHGSRRGHARRWALRDICLTVSRGEMLGLVGPNGSGKTTLLRSIMGTLRPTRGHVRTLGRVSALDALNAGTARDLTGSENLLVLGVLLGMSRAEVRARHDDIAAFAELSEEVLHSPLYTYSEGMGLRMAFSVVVHSAPDVLLVDEVLAVGDDAYQHKCVTKIGELQAGGCGVVLVSHHLPIIAEHCDRVAVLNHAELHHVGLPDEALDVFLDVLNESDT